jgi:hypothetical protein
VEGVIAIRLENANVELQHKAVLGMQSIAFRDNVAYVQPNAWLQNPFAFWEAVKSVKIVALANKIVIDVMITTLAFVVNLE